MPVAVHPAELRAVGQGELLLLRRVGDLDDGERLRNRGRGLEDRRDRRQRRLVAAQQQPLGLVVGGVVDARPGIADGRPERRFGCARARRAARLVQDDVDVDLPGLGIVPADGVVAPLLLGRAGREPPAAQRQDDLFPWRGKAA